MEGLQRAMTRKRCKYKFGKDGRHTTMLTVVLDADQISPCMFCGQKLRKGEKVVKVYDSVTGFDMGHMPCDRRIEC